MLTSNMKPRNFPVAFTNTRARKRIGDGVFTDIQTSKRVDGLQEYKLNQELLQACHCYYTIILEYAFIQMEVPTPRSTVERMSQPCYPVEQSRVGGTLG